MALKLVTPPATEPISLAEAKRHCRVDHSDDDATITFLIAATRRYVDASNGWLGRALVSQTWNLTVDAFPMPASSCQCSSPVTPAGTAAAIMLPWPPLRSVTSVKYVDVNGTQQTMPASDYYVDTVSEPGWIIPLTSWPAAKAVANAIEIIFVAGYGPAATDVPEDIRQAMLLAIGHWYENREAVLSQYQGSATALPLPFAFEALLASYWLPAV